MKSRCGDSWMMVVTSTGASTFSSFSCVLLICAAAFLTVSPVAIAFLS
jgi:hypothetical protein